LRFSAIVGTPGTLQENSLTATERRRYGKLDVSKISVNEEEIGDERNREDEATPSHHVSFEQPKLFNHCDLFLGITD
jgi:hypothetical protein